MARANFAYCLKSGRLIANFISGSAASLMAVAYLEGARGHLLIRFELARTSRVYALFRYSCHVISLREVTTRGKWATDEACLAANSLPSELPLERSPRARFSVADRGYYVVRRQ
jgi:hypothetical protein